MDSTKYYDAPNLDLLAFMPPGATCVADVGCGAGALGELYKRRNPGCRYIGIEHNPAWAALAAKRLDTVYTGDAAAFTAAHPVLGPASIDCLVYGDILEHLADPWAVLRAQAAWLKEDGVVVASIPNAQHWTVIMALMLGRWDYAADGILDRTHLRFFTLATLAELFSQANLEIKDVRMRELPDEEHTRFTTAMAPALLALNLDTELFNLQTRAYQYLVRAVKVG